MVVGRREELNEDALQEVGGGSWAFLGSEYDPNLASPLHDGKCPTCGRTLTCKNAVYYCFCTPGVYFSKQGGYWYMYCDRKYSMDQEVPNPPIPW